MSLTRRVIALLVAAVLGAAALLAASIAPASAHAVLEGSEPAPSDQLVSPPDEIRLRFSEQVDPTLGGIRLYDSGGDRVDIGDARTEADDTEVVADLDSLRDDSYIATWRVASADGHVIRGSFTFTVGEGRPAAVESLAARLLRAEGTDPAVGGAYAVIRFLAFLGLALVVGAVSFVVWCWPQGAADLRTRRLVLGAWITAFLATLATIAVYGPYATGEGLGRVLSPSSWTDVATTTVGRAHAARAAMLMVLAPLLVVLFRSDRRPPRALRGGVGVLLLAISATPAFAGHASSGQYTGWAIALDAVHVAAMAVWLGGLAVLLLVVRGRDEPPGLLDGVHRFSNVALGCVVALALTGSFAAWRQVGSFSALVDTDFGRLLLAKLAAVTVVVLFASASRDVVGKRLAAGGASARRALRISIAGEVVFAVVALAVTAVLVNTPPVAQRGGETFFRTLDAGGGYTVELYVSPAEAGPNQVHATVYAPGGVAADTQDATVTFSEPDRDIAPVEVPVERLAPGHYVAERFDVPFPGDWTVTVEALVDDVTEVEATAEVAVG